MSQKVSRWDQSPIPEDQVRKTLYEQIIDSKRKLLGIPKTETPANTINQDQTKTSSALEAPIQKSGLASAGTTLPTKQEAPSDRFPMSRRQSGLPAESNQTSPLNSPLLKTINTARDSTLHADQPQNGHTRSRKESEQHRPKQDRDPSASHRTMYHELTPPVRSLANKSATPSATKNTTTPNTRASPFNGATDQDEVPRTLPAHVGPASYCDAHMDGLIRQIVHREKEDRSKVRKSGRSGRSASIFDSEEKKKPLRPPPERLTTKPTPRTPNPGDLLRIKRQKPKSPGISRSPKPVTKSKWTNQRNMIKDESTTSQKIAFLIKVYGKQQKDDGFKDAVDFAGLGQILAGLEVFSYFTPDDVDIPDNMVRKIQRNVQAAWEEARLHKELWNYLSFFCYENTELVPAQLVAPMLQTMVDVPPTKDSLRKLKKVVRQYLQDMSWTDPQIEEFENYIDLEIDEEKHYSLIKIYTILHELKSEAGKQSERRKDASKMAAKDSGRSQQPKKSTKSQPAKSVMETSRSSESGTKSAEQSLEPSVDEASEREKARPDPRNRHYERKNKLKQALLPADREFDRTSLMFDGYSFRFIPDFSRTSRSQSPAPGTSTNLNAAQEENRLKEVENERYNFAFNDPISRTDRYLKKISTRSSEPVENSDLVEPTTHPVPARHDATRPEGVLPTARTRQEDAGRIATGFAVSFPADEAFQGPLRLLWQVAVQL